MLQPQHNHTEIHFLFYLYKLWEATVFPSFAYTTVSNVRGAAVCTWLHINKFESGCCSIQYLYSWPPNTQLSSVLSSFWGRMWAHFWPFVHAPPPTQTHTLSSTDICLEPKLWSLGTSKSLAQSWCPLPYLKVPFPQWTQSGRRCHCQEIDSRVSGGGRGDIWSRQGDENANILFCSCKAGFDFIGESQGPSCIIDCWSLACQVKKEPVSQWS